VLRDRPEYLVSDKPLDPFWISGFSDGDGCFSVTITKTNQVIISYIIFLSNRDVSLLTCIQKFFNGIGRISENKKNKTARYIVTKREDLINIIIPHFDKYKLEGDKVLNYLAWKKVLSLVSSKAHFTPEGLEEIKGIKSKLNK